jgi:hypothetical protein
MQDCILDLNAIAIAIATASSLRLLQALRTKHMRTILCISLEHRIAPEDRHRLPAYGTLDIPILADIAHRILTFIQDIPTSCPREVMLIRTMIT